MKERKQNPLRQALAGSGAAGPHPDADVLTAFAEGALVAREREGVLQHLAVCRECRQALGIAAEAMPEGAAVVAMPARRPAMRALAPWLAAAAALLVVSGIVVRQEMRRETQPASVAVKVAPPTPVMQSAPGKPAEATKPRSETAAKSLRREARAAVASEIPSPPAPAQQMEADSLRPQANEVPQAEAAPETANQKVSGAFDAGTAQRQTAPATPTQAAVGGPNQMNQAAAMNQANQSAGTNQAAPTPMREYTNAVADRMRGVTPLSIAQARWRINAKGQPERAFGNGPWTQIPLLQAGRMHAIAVQGPEVWVGGEHAELHRSNDDGATWTPVPLPAKGTSVHTIAHIRLGVAGGIEVEAADGTTWTSEDGGATWN